MREFNTREAKGDYLITFETDDRKAFEQVQTLCRILIDGKDGNAIPIAWIDAYCTDCDIGLRDNDHMPIKKLLQDWKEEHAGS